MMHSIWIAELKLEAYNWYWSLVRVAGGNDNSIWIWSDQRKSIVRVVVIHLKEHVSSVGQVEIVCRFRRDRVSISPGIRWSSAQI